jgi:hypothetical protein
MHGPGKAGAHFERGIRMTTRDRRVLAHAVRAEGCDSSRIRTKHELAPYRRTTAQEAAQRSEAARVGDVEQRVKEQRRSARGDNIVLRDDASRDICAPPIEEDRIGWSEACPEQPERSCDVTGWERLEHGAPRQPEELPATSNLGAQRVV